MKRGQLSLTGGKLTAIRQRGWVTGASLQGRVALGERVQFSLSGGLFYDPQTKLAARDVQLGLPILVVSSPTLVVSITPGASLPLASLSFGLEYTNLATGSVDPTLDVGVTWGGNWLVLANSNARLPLYDGFDRIRQGVYTRSDLRIARRVMGGAVFGGVSLAAQQARGLTSPGFVELAPVGGFTAPLSKNVALAAGVRVPVYTGDAPSPYLVAWQMSITRVFRPPKKG